MSSFINLFEKFHSDITEEEREWLSTKIYDKRFRKNEVITKMGDIANEIYFIEEGITAIIEDYYKDKKKKEFVLDFRVSGDMACVYTSFLNRQPSKLKLMALSPVKAQAMKYDTIQELYETTSWGDRMGRKIAEELFIIKSERERSLMRDSATERYLRLLHTRPELFKRIPLKYIAAHVPISQQAFCRLRSSFVEV
ncbi:MAG: Crp/Fnr family transcriptional regulator [Flavobacteriales bacterium AspAUS03]